MDFLVPPYTVACTVMYHLVPPCTTFNGTVQVQGSTYQYIPVRTDLGITGGSMYQNVPF
jgi:hypothetical protein